MRRTIITTYESVAVARITNPARLDRTPEEVVELFESVGHSEADFERAEAEFEAIAAARLYWAVLSRFVYDLSVVAHPHTNTKGFLALRDARLDFSNTDLFWLHSIGLEPDYVRRKLAEFGYVPPVKFRHVCKRRVKRWNLADALRRERGTGIVRITKADTRQHAAGSIA